MADEAESKQGPSLFEEIREEGGELWRRMPDKGLFFALLAVWLVFFHFLGNSVFGYIDTPSLLRWMYHMYDTSPDDGHGFLIPFVVVALLYWKREQLLAVQKKGSWLALGLLATALLVHVFGYLLQYPQLSVVGFFVGIYALMGVIWGSDWLRATFFPMFLFAFAVPLGSTLAELGTNQMRLMAASITSGFCGGVLGIDVVRIGTQLSDATGRYRYEVEAACAGMRSVIALLAISTVFAFVLFRSYWRRALVILAALPLAVAGNVLRLVGIIVVAEIFGHNAGTFVHDNFVLSLLPYVPAFITLVLIGKFAKEPSVVATAS